MGLIDVVPPQVLKQHACCSEEQTFTRDSTNMIFICSNTTSTHTFHEWMANILLWHQYEYQPTLCLSP